MVEVTLAFTADTTATLGSLLDELELLQGLDNLAGDGAGGIGMVARAGTAVLAPTVHALQGADTSARTDVQVTGNRGYTKRYY